LILAVMSALIWTSDFPAADDAAKTWMTCCPAGP
jgi:hypothetical protein